MSDFYLLINTSEEPPQPNSLLRTRTLFDTYASYVYDSCYIRKKDSCFFPWVGWRSLHRALTHRLFSQRLIGAVGWGWGPHRMIYDYPPVYDLVVTFKAVTQTRLTLLFWLTFFILGKQKKISTRSLWGTHLIISKRKIVKWELFCGV